MRSLICLALVLCAGAGFAVDLPYCRVTLDMGVDDAGQKVTKAVDGWYDETTRCMYIGEQDKFVAPFGEHQVISVVKATRPPGPTPDYAKKAADMERAKVAKQVAAEEKKAGH